MKGIRNSPQDKADLEKEKAKEKKKVVIKDVLGDMKASIHEYKDTKNKIDNGVKESGNKFQTQRAEHELGDIKSTIGKYEHLKDQTVSALKQEGQVLQHEQNMKAKVVLHSIKKDAEKKEHSSTIHDFKKDE